MGNAMTEADRMDDSIGFLPSDDEIYRLSDRQRACVGYDNSLIDSGRPINLLYLLYNGSNGRNYNFHWENKMRDFDYRAERGRLR